MVSAQVCRYSPSIMFSKLKLLMVLALVTLLAIVFFSYTLPESPWASFSHHASLVLHHFNGTSTGEKLVPENSPNELHTSQQTELLQLAAKALNATDTDTFNVSSELQPVTSNTGPTFPAFNFTSELQPSISNTEPTFPRVFFTPRSRVCASKVDKGGGSDNNGSGVFLVVLVLSSYQDNGRQERQAVRETYGSVARGHPWPGGKPLLAPITIVFLLGSPPSPDQERQIREEYGLYKDLLVSDFVDTYQNLTLKVLSGLHWALKACPTARFVMKADDDIFLNLPLVVAFLTQRGELNTVYGHAYISALVHREGRWAVSEACYPLIYYPNYMSGAAYVLARDAAEKIVLQSTVVQHIPVEDAFITGILAHATHVQRVSVEGFTYFLEARASACEFVNDIRLVSNKVTACDKYTLWVKLMTDDRRLCT